MGTKDGKIGENIAALELQKKGLLIIKRNFHSPFGEIDIIALDNDVIVFIEVKSLLVYTVDSLEFAVNKKKQKKIISTAKYFLQNNREYDEWKIRFDVFFIGRDDNGLQTFDHLENAFGESV